MAISKRPAYYAARERDWQPVATYALLGVIGAFFIAQQVVLRSFGLEAHHMVFVIDSQWPYHPWTLVTATLSHDPGGLLHILVNGLVLFFFGPTLERLIGWRRYVVLFFVAGAVASVLQVYFQLFVFDKDQGGLGASGAIMMVFGALMVVMPNEKVLIWGIIPVPFWAAGTGYVLLDLLGTFNPSSDIGNVAHLSGMAIGVWLGWRIRLAMKRRGLRLMHD